VVPQVALSRDFQKIVPIYVSEEQTIICSQHIIYDFVKVPCIHVSRDQNRSSASLVPRPHGRREKSGPPTCMATRL